MWHTPDRTGYRRANAIIEGRDFRNYTEEQRLEIVDKICVSMHVPISCPAKNKKNGKKYAYNSFL
jgi:hypothetical protein